MQDLTRWALNAAWNSLSFPGQPSPIFSQILFQIFCTFLKSPTLPPPLSHKRSEDLASYSSEGVEVMRQNLAQFPAMLLPPLLQSHPPLSLFCNERGVLPAKDDLSICPLDLTSLQH